MQGYIHSLQSMGTLDGPGVRAVVFTEGCPLRCIYCHNPDTWECSKSDLMDASEIAEKILRLYPYIKNGGVTFSGGEPCLQADFICEVISLVSEKGLHIAIDTCGEVLDDKVEKLLSMTDLVLLDIKMTTEEDYEKYTKGSLSRVMTFLQKLQSMNKETWIRHVVVPGINDNGEDIKRLAKLIKGYSCISKIELLPYRSLCIEKYKNLGIEYPLEDTPQMDKTDLLRLDAILRKYINT